MNRSSLRCALAAVLFLVTAWVPARLSAQLDDLLSSLLSGGKDGKIRAVSVASQTGNRAVLAVRYSDVRHPSGLRVTARVLESTVKEIGGFEISAAEVVGAEGSVEVTVEYTGEVPVKSAMVEARLVRTDGRAVAVQVAPLMRRWAGPDAPDVTDAGDGAHHGPLADPLGTGGTSGTSDGQPASTPDTPAPREILLHPTPLPGTPAVGDPPAPTPPTPPASGTGPATTGGGRGRRPDLVGTMIATPVMVAQLAPKLDLYAVAAGARWSNGLESLDFNGSAADARGFVRPLGRTRLVDGRDYDKVLETHPRWADQGRIEGAFDVTLPAAAQSISFALGFLPGADGSDGVRFQLTCESAGETSVWLDEEVGPGSVVQRRVAVPEGSRGRAVRLHLITLAGASSGRDWAVWVAPRVD